MNRPNFPDLWFANEFWTHCEPAPLRQRLIVEALTTTGVIRSGNPRQQETSMTDNHSEFHIDKLLDTYTSKLVDTNTGEDAFVSTNAGTDTPVTLERCFVKSWSTSGDADDRPME